MKPVIEMEHQQVVEFVTQFPFAILMTEDLQVTHLPLVLMQTSENAMILMGHLARNNPQLKQLEGAKVKAVFNQPHAYISPYWYQAAPNVPTWNYAVVHLSGTASICDNDDMQLGMDALLKQMEPKLLHDENYISAGYRQKLSNAIRGIRIEVDVVESRVKLGQHKPNAQQLGVATSLAQSSSLEAQGLIAYMQQIGLGLGQ
ncbi:FMN-binding negative transcriptional regulator [Neptunicella marina]|uniref:FMN-binding negative transcriptional regulator n=1 Tax=Neptunicella marina TaxID=2125989 RepID=A0A8J6IVC9_9ALTE|nr:FMN-binding negative transcriptional regulator [Neptunicella marina]MBC3767054.1 FMN-binding negative transcriptional regulator [Neptunicella marina]